MRIRWRGLELPTKVAPDPKFRSTTFGRFIVEPFERGFGTTIGNSLRRILLSSLEGAAVTAVKIKGAEHEFTSLPGVMEDVTDIVLNVKGLVVRMDSDEPKTIRLAATGPGDVTAELIEADPSITVMNKDHVIATLTEPVDFEMELRVGKGRGYVPASEQYNNAEEQEIGVIPVDAIYSPVQRVRYNVEETRVGQRTDYDRLSLTVETNGTVSPEEAVSYAAALAQTHFQYFVSFGSHAAAAVAVPGAEGSSDAARLAELLRTPIDDLRLSVRSVNSLKNSSIRSLGDLVRQTETQILQVKNFGKKSLQEIADLLEKEGLNFGMRFEESTDGVRIADIGTPPSRAAANAPDDEEE